MSRAVDRPVAILAGGLATRLRPITETVPKALLEVAGRPFLAHQLDLLRDRGIRRVVLCVGHLGERVRESFPDGMPWGMQLEYSFDGPTLLGTGGAVRQALPLLGENFFVLYGDSYLPTDYGAVADAFARSGKMGLMTVFRNEGKWDTSNVVFRDGRILVYDKLRRSTEMRHIDYGLSALTADAFAGWEAKTPLDLVKVFQKLVADGELAGYEVHERFYEAGSASGLAELNTLLGKRT
jgi:NDP-sugar pyrophosphorylase family protein